MATIFVSGLINLETTLQVEGFPIEYAPVRYPFWGVQTAVSGVGYNIARALGCLGDEARLASLVGGDEAGRLVRQALAAAAISGDLVLETLDQTAQSVILYDRAGRRQINTDLKDIQERAYPLDAALAAAEGCALAALCNINFSRPLLAAFKQRGIPIASDVHAIGDLEDEYNRDFMAAADILFMSHERLPGPPEAGALWAARQVLERYGPRIVVVGMGAAGALLAVRADRFFGWLPATTVRPIVSTIGAGDALFSAFLHGYVRTGDPYAALKQATLFASYKIGAPGGAQGFLSAADLAALCRERGGDLDYRPAEA